MRAVALEPPRSFDNWLARGLDGGAASNELRYRYDEAESFRIVIANRDGSRRIAADTSIDIEAVGSRPKPGLLAFAIGVFFVVQGVAIGVGRLPSS